MEYGKAFSGLHRLATCIPRTAFTMLTFHAPYSSRHHFKGKKNAEFAFIPISSPVLAINIAQRLTLLLFLMLYFHWIRMDIGHIGYLKAIKNNFGV